jgi:uncharacterized protein with PIN domain
MLGCEVKYFKASDDDLLTVAKDENRILLTRDLELFCRAKDRGLGVFFVEGKDESEKLANISKHFNIKLEIDMSKSRCPICGVSLKTIEKSSVLNKIPKETIKHHENFWKCTNCEKIYWKGRHWKNINETLAKAKELLINIKTSEKRQNYLYLRRKRGHILGT